MAGRAWNHNACAGHFRHPSFTRKLCWQNGESEQEARTFAAEIAAVRQPPSRSFEADRRMVAALVAA